MSDCFDHFAESWDRRDYELENEYSYSNHNYRAYKKEIREMDNILNIVFDKLKLLEPYKYHVSLNGSTYIKFDNANIGSLRISDHKEREKYGYRWNLRFDIKEKRIVDDRKYKQYYYPLLMTEELCKHMINFDKKIEENKK